MQSGASHGGGHRIGVGVGQGGQVVVFDEDPIVQPHAMVDSAPAAHGVFLESPPPGRGFAGVQDAGAGALQKADVAGGGRGDAGEALHEIQGHPFCREQGPRGADDFEQGGAGWAGLPVVDASEDPSVGGKFPESHFGEFKPRHGQRFAGVHPGRGFGVGGDAGQTGGVAGSEVFLEGLDNGHPNQLGIQSLHAARLQESRSGAQSAKRFNP